MKCCASGTFVMNPDQNCANYATGLKGAKCAANCGANEIELCTSGAECQTMNCVPFSSHGNQVGACR